MFTPVAHDDVGGSPGAFVPTSFAALTTVHASPPAIFYDVLRAVPAT